MDIFLIILVLGGTVQAFRLKRISYKIASVVIAVYAGVCIFWNDKPDMGPAWLLLYAPFFAYMIFIHWQQFTEEHNKNKTNEDGAKELPSYVNVGATILFLIAIATFIVFIIWGFLICID